MEVSMNPNEKRPHYYQNGARWTQPYSLGSRKRQIIDRMMADMQEQYDEMIEAAVEASGFKEADEVIKHVMSL